MKKQYRAGMLILSLLLNACGTTPAPTENPQQVQETAMAGALTAIAQTQAAMPTFTPLPPTSTPIPPTETPLPSPTLEPTVAATPTALPATAGPTADPCNKPLTSWEGPSATLSIFYDYTPQKKDDKVVVSIWVMSDLGECGFLYNLSSGPVGQYSVTAYVDGVKDFTVHGGFRITESSWKIIIRNDKIIAMGVCYPNC